MACDADFEGGGALAELSQEELSEYHGAIDEHARKTGLDLLRPTYLPRGTDWKPESGYGVDENEAVLTFYRGEFDTVVSESPVIRIAQVSDPDREVCPPCDAFDESDLEEWSAGSRAYVTDVGRSGPGRSFATIYFRAGELRVAAHFDWESATQTNEMKQEALKVVESMFESD